MKKTIIMAAGLAAAACTQLAQAQSAVTVYGILDEFLSYGDAGAGRNLRLDSSGSLASRIGFRGSEDLGSGYKVNFLLEAGINADSGTQPDTTRLFNRQAWVGFSGAAGELRVGRQNTSMFFMLGRYDALDATTQSSGLANLAPFTPRYDNMIGYMSPVWNGLKLEVQYGAGEVAGNTQAGANYHVQLEYVKGGLSTGINYEENNDIKDIVKTRNALLGASYDFGKSKAFLAYHGARNNVGTLDRDVYSVSGLYRVTPADIVSLGFSVARDHTVADSGGRQVGLLYQHFLSKRTLVYSGVSRLKNMNQAVFTLNGAAVKGELPVRPGADISGLQLGLRHVF